HIIEWLGRIVIKRHRIGVLHEQDRCRNTISLSAALLESLKACLRDSRSFDTQPACLATIETWNHLIPSRTQPGNAPSPMVVCGLPTRGHVIARLLTRTPRPAVLDGVFYLGPKLTAQHQAIVLSP